jgi:flagellar hook protein FlgE
MSCREGSPKSREAVLFLILDSAGECGMIRSLFTSSSGLQAHQRFLDVVGNNLANVNTTGFKAQRVRFADQFSQTLRAHTLPNGSLGGTNPIQVGNGVKVAATDTIFTQGSIEQSGNALDLAIQGGGFFVVNDGAQDLYSRVGAFSIDSQNFLVDSASGYRVRRVGVVGEGTPTSPAFQVSGNNGISIPQGETIPGSATTRIDFQGNLDAAASGPLKETVVINTPFTESGVAASAATLLDDLDQTSAGYAAGDVVFITGTTTDGQSVNAQFVAVGGTDTLQNLLDSINAAYGAGSPNGATASIDTQGRIVLTADREGPSELTMNLSSSDVSPTTGNTTFNNFVVQVDGKDGDTTTTAVEIFDEQDAAHTINFTFQKKGDNSWDLISAIDPTGTFSSLDNFVQGITFNEDGSFQAVSGGDAREVLTTIRPLTFSTGGTTSTTSAVAATTLDSLDQTTGTLAALDEILINGTTADGTAFSATFVAAGAGADTLGDLVTFLNTPANILDAGGAPVALGGTFSISGGNIVLQADVPGPAELSVEIATAPTAGAQIAFDNFFVATEGTDGDDSIEFEINNLTGFGTSQTIQLALGAANNFDSLTQFGGFTTAAARSQDGSGPGSLVTVAVSSDGVINGVFSNGQSHELGQIAIATFANPESLDRVAGNYFSDNGNSGPAILAPALTNGAGSIQNSALESSNVDISFEFTQLITAQRGFQVNARAFSTADQVLQEAVNLVQ